MPKPAELAFYWDQHPDCCWCCGRGDAILERAHIVARMDGGLDYCPNLLLLCPSCHHWQEVVSRLVMTRHGLASLEMLTRRGHLLPLIREVQQDSERRVLWRLYGPPDD